MRASSDLMHKCVKSTCILHFRFPVQPTVIINALLQTISKSCNKHFLCNTKSTRRNICSIIVHQSGLTVWISYSDVFHIDPIKHPGNVVRLIAHFPSKCQWRYRFLVAGTCAKKASCIVHFREKFANFVNWNLPTLRCPLLNLVICCYENTPCFLFPASNCDLKKRAIAW